MNKEVKFIITMFLFITILVGINTALTFIDNIIIRECEVECLADNVAYFRDGEGNIWGWELGRGEGYHLGQKVSLLMNTNNTKELKDDFILKIRLDKSK